MEFHKREDWINGRQIAVSDKCNGILLLMRLPLPQVCYKVDYKVEFQTIEGEVPDYIVNIIKSQWLKYLSGQGLDKEIRSYWVTKYIISFVGSSKACSSLYDLILDELEHFECCPPVTKAYLSKYEITFGDSE